MIFIKSIYLEIAFILWGKFWYIDLYINIEKGITIMLIYRYNILIRSEEVYPVCGHLGYMELVVQPAMINNFFMAFFYLKN